ncbi:YxlC family protein [Paenibacillus sp. PL2-23]|uniref:YxlC family protein n=1 Tax=Paenibacillus sp. PL2-23 TaxID=2100729 RepID=UPI0030F5C67F
MKRNDAHDDDQQWFDARLKADLQSFDEAFDSPPHDVAGLALLVGRYQKELNRRLWRELALFWLVAAILLAAVFGLLERSLALFVVLQGITALSALLIIGMTVWRRRKSLWKSS